MGDPAPGSTASGPERRALLRRESEQMSRLRRTTSLNDVVRDSARRALGGGLAGAAAMTVQVSTLMWMRTTVMYQYRYGSTTGEALRALYRQGGVRRFYQGVVPALLQAPLSRFGDTAANTGVMALLNAHESTYTLPTGVKTLVSAAAATCWRVCLSSSFRMQTRNLSTVPSRCSRTSASAVDSATRHVQDDAPG